ncbi:MAG: ATP synthase subunit C [Gammaproteobacteria bacterium]|nr:ATP synthase subunit C [Gammaproteobacteria bacterium]
MSIITILLTVSALGSLLFGTYLVFSSRQTVRLNPRWLKGGLVFNIALFAAGLAGLLISGIGEVMAAETATDAAAEFSLGRGLALIGVGLPTAIATIGAGIAVSSVGSASLAVITEKPEMFGRTLVYLGLAEGIAIYGLVISILLLGRL